MSVAWPGTLFSIKFSVVLLLYDFGLVYWYIQYMLPDAPAVHSETKERQNHVIGRGLRIHRKSERRVTV